MKLIVSLDRDEDSVWIAECPSIPGCVSQGSTSSLSERRASRLVRW